MPPQLVMQTCACQQAMPVAMWARPTLVTVFNSMLTLVVLAPYLKQQHLLVLEERHLSSSSPLFVSC